MIRKICFVVLALLMSTVSWAGAPARVSTYVPLTTIRSSDVTSNEDAIFNYLQSGVSVYESDSITNDAVDSAAGILASKLNLSGISQNIIHSGTFTQSSSASFTTITDLGAVTTADINGGTLDGVTIGGSSAGAGTFTTLTIGGQSLFNTSSGHDHDGSDSKKVVATNLDMTGTTDTQYLYNNAGTLASKALVQSYEFVSSSATSTSVTFSGLSTGYIYEAVFSLTSSAPGDSAIVTITPTVTTTVSWDTSAAQTTGNALILTPVASNGMSESRRFGGKLTVVPDYTDNTQGWVESEIFGIVKSSTWQKVEYSGYWNSDAAFTSITISFASSGSPTGTVWLYRISKS